ncbi:Os08g0550301, partial [Oryza sativa Japonica Group]
RLAGLLVPVGARRDRHQDRRLQPDASEHPAPHPLHAAAERERDGVADGDADAVVAAQVDVRHQPLPPGADGHAGEHRLDAVEEEREGEHHAQARHRAHHLRAARERRAVHVAEQQHRREEGDADGDRGHEHHRDREPRRPRPPRAQLVRHPHADRRVEPEEHHDLPPKQFSLTRWRRRRRRPGHWGGYRQ